MIRTQCTQGKIGLIAGTAFLLLTTAPVWASGDQHEGRQRLDPNVATGGCQANAMAYSISTDLQKSGSRNFRDVSGTGVSFTQGVPGCVEVSFSAEAATLPGEILVAQALLDGAPCLPGDNHFASDSPSADLADHAMNYVCTSVSAGSHSAKMQFRSRFGGQVALDFRTTIVRYAK